MVSKNPSTGGALARVIVNFMLWCGTGAWLSRVFCSFVLGVGHLLVEMVEKNELI